MGTEQERDRWESLDQSADPGWFVHFLDETSTQPCHLHPPAVQLLKATPGARILDVGCGTGEDARHISELVGPTGEVVGIDASNEMITVARQRSLGRVDVRFEVASAGALPFNAGSFDACWIKRTLMHLHEPAAALAEVARVLVPSGRLVAVEPDCETLLLDSSLVEVTRRLLAYRASGYRNPRIGRQLRRLLLDAGFADIDVTIQPQILTDWSGAEKVVRLTGLVESATAAGAVSAPEATQWLEEQEQRDRGGAFLCCLLGFAAIGRVPAN